MAYGGYNLRPAPFGFPTVSPWPAGFQPVPPQMPQTPPQQNDPMMGGTPGGVPSQGPMFPGLASRFPRLAQAGQAVRGFIQNFDQNHPNVANFRRNNADMLSNVGMALLTTRPGDNAPVREAFYYGRQSDQERRAAAEAAAQEQARRDSLRQLITGGASGAPGGFPAPTTAPGRNDGSWMVRGSGATGTNNPPEIVYANQNATRNDPIAPALQTALQAAAAEAGIDRIVVVSGGQEAEGEGGERTGSTRHDHGNAADVDLYVGGRRLDFNNPQDQAIYQQFVAAAVRNGVTGIGAGEGYMGGNGRIHVGFGAPAVWGAGGSSANAPEWLRTAYSGAGGGQTTPTAQGGMPRLTPEQQQWALALLDINPQAAEQYLMSVMQPAAPNYETFNPEYGLYNTTEGAWAVPPQTGGAAEGPYQIGEVIDGIGANGQTIRLIYQPGHQNANEFGFVQMGGERLPSGMSITLPDGTVISQGGAGGTQAERQAAYLYGVTEPELPIIEETFPALANLGNQLAARGGDVTYWATSPEYQRAANSLRVVVTNYLYSVSGQAAPAAEVENWFNALMPRIGESQPAIDDKLNRIRNMLAQMSVRAGNPAAPGVQGNPTDWIEVQPGVRIRELP